MVESSRREGSQSSVTRTLRTSVTDPLRCSFLPPEATGLPGKLGLTMCPGRRQHAISGIRWKRDLAADLDRLAEVEGVNVLVTLVEDDELERLGASNLRAWAERQRMDVLRLAIPDAGIPSVGDARRLVTRIVDALRTGRSVCIHCAAGLGRSGTIAACVLVALGQEAEEAVRTVRAARPGAIENDRQRAFVSKFKAHELKAIAKTKAGGRPKKAAVINLGAAKKQKIAYQAAVAVAREQLEELHRRAFSAAVSIACAGPWATWSDAQPSGAVVAFTAEMLAASDDPRVASLAAVVGAIEDAQETLGKVS
ncbi:MAG: cyclin-dependent kinase inhibitor 3 family protein [Deltaproteobacteria bacterium]|jgi:protein-tyrosine phosphatase|nr:cyclin-dependent kinase inhibitor 3 family protein [Deltaproteobacteria bacterium]MBK7067159.1 cyclin-dependent kinase inhibitor 3 family protein [Deltaproteobacteria bacterium]MBP6830350.1 cyclin-dependent kinase inhibitor 3 family protein [Deltaproteobacteria bacterium]